MRAAPYTKSINNNTNNNSSKKNDVQKNDDIQILRPYWDFVSVFFFSFLFHLTIILVFFSLPFNVIFQFWIGWSDKLKC